jgi:hypothetical protein
MISSPAEKRTLLMGAPFDPYVLSVLLPGKEILTVLDSTDAIMPRPN